MLKSLLLLTLSCYHPSQGEFSFDVPIISLPSIFSNTLRKWRKQRSNSKFNSIIFPLLKFPELHFSLKAASFPGIFLENTRRCILIASETGSLALCWWHKCEGRVLSSLSNPLSLSWRSQPRDARDSVMRAQRERVPHGWGSILLQLLPWSVLCPA